MPGITEKTVSSNNWNMAFKALDELTVGREQNRGTIEVVKRDDLGGMVEGDAGAVTLKCSHHHWYSRGLDTVSQSQAIDLNTFVEKTVVDAVNDICDELLKNNPLQKEGINDKRTKLIEQFRAEIGRFTQHGENAISPLSREQIKTIVLQVKNLKAMTAERLLNSGIDSVENIKEWAKGELDKLPSQANVRTKFSTLLKAFVARPDVAQAAVLEKARHRGVDLLDSFLASALDTIKQSKSDVSVGGNLGKLLNASNLDASFPGITERIDSILKSVGDINLNLTDVENDVNFNKNWEHRALGKNVQQGEEKNINPETQGPSKSNEPLPTGQVDQPQESLLIDGGVENKHEETNVEVPQGNEQGAEIGKNLGEEEKDEKSNGAETKDDTGEKSNVTNEISQPTVQPHVVNKEGEEEEISTKTQPKMPEVNGAETIQKFDKKGPVTEQMEAELAKKLKGVTKRDKRKDIISEHFHNCLANKKYVAEQKKVDYKFETGDAYFKKHSELNAELEGRTNGHAVKKNPFMKLNGYSTDVLRQLYQMVRNNPELLEKFRPALLLFADDTFCGCGIVQGWGTQEESTLRDFGPGLMAHFLGNGLIGKENNRVFPYVEHEGKEVNTARDGWTASVNLQYVGTMEQEGVEGMKVDLVGRSTSSLGDQDVKGNVRHMQCCREKVYGEPSLTKKQVETARNFQKAIYKQLESYKIPLRSKAEAVVEKLFMYTTEFNPLAKDQAAEVKRLVDFALSTNEADVARRKKLLETADANFEKVFRNIVRSDIIKEREKRVSHFIGGAIGCGAFCHDIKVIARIYAEEFVRHGGNMVFVMPNVPGGEGNTVAFEEAFGKAFQEVLQKAAGDVGNNVQPQPAAPIDGNRRDKTDEIQQTTTVDTINEGINGRTWNNEKEDFRIDTNPYLAVERLYTRIDKIKADKTALVNFLNGFFKENFPLGNYVFTEDNDIVSALADANRFNGGMVQLYDLLNENHGFSDADDQLTRNDEFLTIFEQRVASDDGI